MRVLLPASSTLSSRSRFAPIISTLLKALGAPWQERALPSAPPSQWVQGEEMVARSVVHDGTKGSTEMGKRVEAVTERGRVLSSEGKGTS